MPFVNLPAATITLTAIDASGSKGYLSGNINNATDIAAARTAAASLATAFQDASGCFVMSHSITYTAKQNDTPTPQPGSRVEQKGNFVFNTDVGKTAQVTIPGILAAAVEPSGRINEDEENVAAFIAVMLAAPWTDSNGIELVSLNSAWEDFSKTRKNQRPSIRIPDADTVE